MSTYFLAPAPSTPGTPGVAPREPIPTVTLESLDRNRRIVLNGRTGWIRVAGSTGLEMPPFNVATAALPGVAGSTVQDVRVEERPIFIPIHVASSDSTQINFLLMMDQVRSLVDPLTGMFRVVGTTSRGERELTVVYTGGLEGSDGRDEAGLYWRRFGIKATACEPFARDRSDRLVEFAIASEEAGPFIGEVGDTDALWPRSLGTSSVIGSGMRINVRSEVPVYPTVELVGPMDSFSGTVALEDGTLPPYYGGAEWSVSIPGGVPAGQTLRLVTDPRARSIRLNGELAAGSVARGSTLRPFYPGVNVMDVAAPGGTEETRVRIMWRELYRSLW